MDLGNLTQMRDNRLNRSHGVPPCKMLKANLNHTSDISHKVSKDTEMLFKAWCTKVFSGEEKNQLGGSVIVSQLFLQPLSSSSVHLLATDKSNILFVTSRPSLTTDKEDFTRGVSLRCFNKNEEDLCLPLRLFNQFKLNTIHLTVCQRNSTQKSIHIDLSIIANNVHSAVLHDTPSRQSVPLNVLQWGRKPTVAVRTPIILMFFLKGCYGVNYSSRLIVQEEAITLKPSECVLPTRKWAELELYFHSEKNVFY